MGAVRPIRLQETCLGETISAETLVFPEGVRVTIYGGQRPHIGAVSVAGPDGGVHTVQFPGHRDAAVSERWAEALRDRGWAPAVVEAGIHYDDLSRQGIEEVLRTTDRMLAVLLAEMHKDEMDP